MTKRLRTVDPSADSTFSDRNALVDSWHGHLPIPRDFPVKIIDRESKLPGCTTCAVCGLSWDGDTMGMTLTYAGRCPFEAFHMDAADHPLLDDDGEPEEQNHGQTGTFES